MRYAILISVLSVGAIGMPGAFSTFAQQLPPPTFRTGVRLVEVDVTVRDKDDQFVDTLTSDDFEVLEDGVPRPIQQSWVVNLPAGRKNDPLVGAATPVLPSLIGSDMDVGRLYVLVLGNGPRDRIQMIASQFITEFLGPSDLMAVVHVSNRALTQGLTHDRELLLAAVDRYRGGGSSEAVIAMLKEVAISLNASTGRRKAVLFIGDGFVLWSPNASPGSSAPAAEVTGGSGAPGFGAVEAGVRARKLVRVFEDMERAARSNNVRIYPIDPVGWRGSVGLSDQVASLRILAADTDGISIANTNNYGGNFKKIVRDNSAYYLLTYESAADPDGRSHPIRVRLRNHPRLSLEQGRRALITSRPDVKGRPVPLPKELSREARSALTANTPGQGPQIQLSTAVFQADHLEGSVLIGTHVPGGWLRLAPKERIELAYEAIDRWGEVRGVVRRAFTLNLGAQSRSRVEEAGLQMFGRLAVPRGQYQIRVVARQDNGATATALADVEVPDYADQPLTISEFVVASEQTPTLLTLEEDRILRGVLPKQPTPARHFAPNDTLTVFAEIYDSHWILSQEVGLTMTVTANDGRVVLRREQVLTSANKGRFNMTATVPLETFAAGDYQLLVEVNTRVGIPANASRGMSFSVRDEDVANARSGATS